MIREKHARNDDRQTGLLEIVKTFSDDIKWIWIVKVCNKASFKGKAHRHHMYNSVDLDTCIKELEQKGTPIDPDSYLGVTEGSESSMLP